MAATPHARPAADAAPVRGFIRELDGLRGIAILFVIFHHFWPLVGPLSVASEVAHLGWIGVDLFYVISGFLITGILLDTRGEPGYYRNYLARRALRVFPLYYLFVAAAFFLIPHAQGGPFWQTEFVQQSGSPVWYAFYLGNVREAIVGHEPAYILAPLWSLSIEEQFYLTFPFLVAFLERRSLTRLLFVMLAFAPLFRLVTMLLFPPNERIQYLATFSRCDVLALGCLLAIYYRSGLPRPSATGRRALSFALLACIAALTVAFLLDGLDRNLWFCRVIGYSMIGLTMSTFVFWTLEHRGSRATAFLRFPGLTFLGKLCYGIYLLQRPSEVILLRIFGRLGIEPDPASVWLMLAKCGFAFALAAASWYAFEKPILKLKRYFESRRHPGAGAPA
jgi:peptidoglycan/LPS O-acetylase OafA/YrhL